MKRNVLLGIGYLKGKILGFKQVGIHIVYLHWSSSFYFRYKFKNHGCCGDVTFSFIGEGDFATNALADSTCESDFKLECWLGFDFKIISFKGKILAPIIFHPVADSSKGFIFKFNKLGDCLSQDAAKDDRLLFRNIVR